MINKIAACRFATLSRIEYYYNPHIHFIRADKTILFIYKYTLLHNFTADSSLQTKFLMLTLAMKSRNMRLLQILLLQFTEINFNKLF